LVFLALFAAGVLHGLGPDHLAALAALIGKNAGPRAPRELAWLGLRFGFGHVGALLFLAVVAWALGATLSDPWQRALEKISGALLVFLGGWLLADVFRRRVVLHSHPHSHHHGEVEHEHPHIHLGADERSLARHGHPHLALAAGGLMGFSGARSLLVALPLVLAGSPGAALAGVAAFGLGIVVSMTAAGWLGHQAFARLGAAGYARLLVGATGAVSAGLGLFWLARFAVG